MCQEETRKSLKTRFDCGRAEGLRVESEPNGVNYNEGAGQYAPSAARIPALRLRLDAERSERSPDPLKVR